MSEAEKFAAVLREESRRRANDRYVHHALIRTRMRTMAALIERWERMDFTVSGEEQRETRDAFCHVLRDHEALPGLPRWCACGHRGDTKYQREIHLAEALLAVTEPDLQETP